MRICHPNFLLFCALWACSAEAQSVAPVAPPNQVTVDWNRVFMESRSTSTLQVVVNPLLRPGSPLKDAAYQAVKDLGADYVRYVPWLPYPRLAVAELEPPTKEKTSWDFSLIDPMTKDFLGATEGHPTVMNFSTIPSWLFETDKPVAYPADPNQVFWAYTQGTELKDRSLKELGDYYTRLVSWYTRGGFTDENGLEHKSGYHYKFPVWEVLNEADFEHRMTPQQYTERYDAIVNAIRIVSPETRFMGLALAGPSATPETFQYFLNPSNHRAGTPVDYISYHFYASPVRGEDINTWQYTFFDQADRFLATTRYIESIRQHLSPQTKADTDELGVILPTDDDSNHGKAEAEIPIRYWNAAASLFAYLSIELTKMGIDVIGESQLVGYPTQFPSVSMMDWKSNKPNARYWVLRLIKENFQPGDQLVSTRLSVDSEINAQGFHTRSGNKLLLCNQRNRTIDVTLPAGAEEQQVLIVDEASGVGPARAEMMHGTHLALAPFAVAVVYYPAPVRPVLPVQ